MVLHNSVSSTLSQTPLCNEELNKSNKIIYGRRSNDSNNDNKRSLGGGINNKNNNNTM